MSTAILTILAIIVTVVVAYTFWLRPILRDHPWFDPFYDWIEPIEARLWEKSRTILVARLAWVSSGLLMIHDVLGQWMFDYTPIITKMFSRVPEGWRPMAITAAFAGYAGLVEWLRRKTTEPLSDKE